MSHTVRCQQCPAIGCPGALAREGLPLLRCSLFPCTPLLDLDLVLYVLFPFDQSMGKGYLVFPFRSFGLAFGLSLSFLLKLKVGTKNVLLLNIWNIFSCLSLSLLTSPRPPLKCRATQASEASSWTQKMSSNSCTKHYCRVSSSTAQQPVLPSKPPQSCM